MCTVSSMNTNGEGDATLICDNVQLLIVPQLLHYNKNMMVFEGELIFYSIVAYRGVLLQSNNFYFISFFYSIIHSERTKIKCWS